MLTYVSESGFGMALAEFVDRVIDFLPRADAFSFEDLRQRGYPSHVVEGQLFEGDDFFGVEGIQSRSPDNFGGD